MKKKMRSQIPQLLRHCLVIVLFHFCPESILREQNDIYDDMQGINMYYSF